MISIKSMALLLLLLLLSFFSSTATADPIFSICNTSRSSTRNFNSKSTYSSNLNHLVSTLSAKVSVTGFASSTTGAIPDPIYGLALCRGDVDSATCRSCISQAISDIQKLCPYNKDASVWYDYCQLSYADPDYLFVPDVQKNIQFLMFNTLDITAERLLLFEILATALIGNMSDLAAMKSSLLFATGETRLTTQENIYGMVQCSRDLSVGDCHLCLQETSKWVAESPLKGRRGGRVVGTWCNMRYEIYKFYKGTSMLQLSYNKTQSTANGSAPNTSIQPPDLAHEGGKNVVIQRVEIFLPVGILLLISSIICFIWLRKRRKKGTSELQKDRILLSQGTDLASKLKIKENNLEFSLFNFSTIMEATDYFSAANKLGQGGFGSVYKGQIPTGESIAVKRLDAFSGQGLEEFMNEIRLIAKLQHQNLVKLLGCCIEGDEKLLVYECMPNNSLDYHLFDLVRKGELGWPKRFSIIDGIAQGLLYLHKYSRVKIIHRDLKASNVLLDLEMNPKISDFGMARIFDATTAQTNTNRIVGTYGYMSPEYAMEGLFSVKSDVFSFGVLILEIISGMRNTTFHKSGKALNLLAHAWELWKNGKWLDFIDPSLGDKIITNEVSKCIIVALKCVQENAADRPLISEVITMLGSESVIIPDLKKPAFFTARNEEASELSIYQLASLNDITITILEGR